MESKLIKEYFVLKARYLYMKREHQNSMKNFTTRKNNSIETMNRMVWTFTCTYFEKERQAAFSALKHIIHDMLLEGIDFIGDMLITKEELPINDTHLFFPRFVRRSAYCGYI